MMQSFEITAVREAGEPAVFIVTLNIEGTSVPFILRPDDEHGLSPLIRSALMMGWDKEIEAVVPPRQMELPLDVSTSIPEE